MSTCRDEDECWNGNNDCHYQADCTNTEGSFTCQCKTGFTEADNGDCEDLDECDTGAFECHEHATCSNTVGSYTCSCKDGWQGGGQNCQDKNECRAATWFATYNDCHETLAACTNIPGSYE